MPQSSGIWNCVDMESTSFNWATTPGSNTPYVIGPNGNFPTAFENLFDIMHPRSCYYKWNEEFFQFLNAFDDTIPEYVTCVTTTIDAGWIAVRADIANCNAELSDEALKISALYSRGSVIESCTNTPQTAKEMFQKLVDADLVCSFAIANDPFNCEATFPLPIEQRFSLAYANSLLLYAVFSTICVKIFFAANSNKEDEDDRAEVEEKPTRI